jgi:precorrin-6A/cobalt-precorrin-6A reductase
MKILLLGGIGEALYIARALHEAGHKVIYSLAGVGRVPLLPCRIRVGGFGGIDGLVNYLRDEGTELLIDATHPYAEQISRNAAEAGARAGVPVWAYRRPAWQPSPQDRWIPVSDWPAARAAIANYRRPFLTLGGKLVSELAEISPGQHWLLRCLASTPVPKLERLTVIGQVGPFHLEQERALMTQHRIDVLVCKNSGGGAVAAKLEAARELKLPVVMIERPALPELAKQHERVADLLGALG